MVFDPDTGCVRRPFGRKVPKFDAPDAFPQCCPYHEDGGWAGTPCPSYVTEPPPVPEPPAPDDFCPPPAPNFDKLEEAIRHGVSGGYTEDCMVMVDGKCVSPFCDL